MIPTQRKRLMQQRLKHGGFLPLRLTFCFAPEGAPAERVSFRTAQR